MSGRRLLLVHAHPDDECIGTGGTIARYASEGAHVCLVTCTNGELGEVAHVPELGDPEEVRERLGAIRIAELREACNALGDVDLRLLGYHDSGMAGTPENDSAVAFVNQELDMVAGRIAEIIREVKPQALVTYNEVGFYGHPDHIRAHEAALAAVEAASSEHRVSKIYYTAMPKSFLRAAREMSKEFGFDEDDFVGEDEIDRLGTDDDAITTAIDVTPFVERKFRALAAHRTQLGTTQRLLEIPEDIRPFAMGTEHFVLARTAEPKPAGIERDLFEGLDV